MRKIDLNKCDKCSGLFLCVEDCVTHYIKRAEYADGEFPEFQARGYCINCGHCEAVCKNKAIQGEAPDIDNELLKRYAMKRTVRKYDSSKKIEKEKLDLILAAGQTAPTQKNKATVRILLINKMLEEIYLDAVDYMKEIVDEVGTRHPQYSWITEVYENRNPILWGAEYAVMLCGKDTAAVDAAIAAERMQLMAQDLGVASGYNGNLSFAVNSKAKLREKLELKPNEKVHVAFALGYSEYEYSNPYICSNKKISWM